MLSEILLSFLPYAFVTGFTPGPNNILALNTISNNGWQKGKSMIIGISAGFVCVMIICALGCFGLSKFIPTLIDTMKYIGAVYIIYLAIHVAKSRPNDENKTQTKSFWSGFILQFVNVKIILYGITVYMGYVIPVSKSIVFLLVTAICSSIVGISGTITWALAGGFLKKYINRYYRVFNITMALILVWSALKLILA
ncbi:MULTISPECIES: LysE family transporter [unclassified Clostridioides]|uniref:LysE family transporter n=1 Tax=unclassified Clostridioides TaxID=2635829 RepID=UPI001D12D472|nr:LysE family transporter [Clostridioides sp. ZZV14-6150]MCC0659024.1 LysE family transporter [Clostridioides sp. ZZV14-6154]MCC0667883.1 LysE family transporter [Clostridioides sp. ZZV14-6153]MCC0723695.1 LysE family transporter [Clostridioides sp. ZZV14-6104]MCC0724881.1 LysE family transporter [Clostridioides sp. ZZV14-6045]MCC0730747.1 LysE family transporter [Clostridioides sp. ZZV14-6048]MCC0736696.1 LysE family transporter [Clostridioides sp. ZZV14-6009]MCC0741484.1 LysE family trans